jgi:Domain of unknown function (DUF4111)
MSEWPRGRRDCAASETERHGLSDELLVTFATKRATGHTLFGPRPEELFTPVPRDWLTRALIGILEWHQAKVLDPFHDHQGPYSILNACRAWRSAEQGICCSKTEGGDWVLARQPDNVLVRNALDMRASKNAQASTVEEVSAFLKIVKAKCRESLG